MLTGSCQLVEQRLSVPEVGGLEAIGEPVVDRREGCRGPQPLALTASSRSRSNRDVERDGWPVGGRDGKAPPEPPRRDLARDEVNIRHGNEEPPLSILDALEKPQIDEGSCVLAHTLPTQPTFP
jgi:hypothetical protein